LFLSDTLIFILFYSHCDAIQIVVPNESRRNADTDSWCCAVKHRPSSQRRILPQLPGPVIEITHIDLFLPDVSGDSFTIRFGRDGELNVSLYINWFNIM
jgi:hypothetical protein